MRTKRESLAAIQDLLKKMWHPTRPRYAMVLQDPCPREAAEQVLVDGVDFTTHCNPVKSEGLPDTQAPNLRLFMLVLLMLTFWENKAKQMVFFVLEVLLFGIRSGCRFFKHVSNYKYANYTAASRKTTVFLL